MRPKRNTSGEEMLQASMYSSGMYQLNPNSYSYYAVPYQKVVDSTVNSLDRLKEVANTGQLVTREGFENRDRKWMVWLLFLFIGIGIFWIKKRK